MGRYAEGTTVEVEKSRMEIEKIVRRYGATQFSSGWDTRRNMAMVGFVYQGYHIRFLMSEPTASDYKPGKHGNGHKKDLVKIAEDERRRRWRALCLAIKAKLEVVETGIASFEDEFLANILLPDGKDVGEWMKPQLEEAYKIGTMPKLLALPEPKGE